MNKKLALELAKRWVKTPKKVGTDWIIEWLDRTIIQKESFNKREDAYAFYYSKIRHLKETITTHGK